MFRWPVVDLRFLILLLCLSAGQSAIAQTVVREISLPQNQAGTTAVIGLLGEFNRCAAYEISQNDLNLNTVISQSGGLTPKASGIIRVIRGGRVSQDLFYSPDTDFPLMNGDVLIGLENSNNAIDLTNNLNGNNQRPTATQATPQLIQIAILNLVDRPIVFGVPPEIANLAGILRCLRQPLDQYPQIAQNIKVISPQRNQGNPRLSHRTLTTSLASGTVLVLGPASGINLAMIPQSLPAPRRLQAEPEMLREAPATEAPNELSRSNSRSLESSPFHPVTRVTEKAPAIRDEISHQAEQSQSMESPEAEEKASQLELKGPVLQQTAATLTQIPKPNTPHSEENDFSTKTENESSSNSSSVPELKLAAAPPPPQNQIQILDDEDLPKHEEFDDAESSGWPLWMTYLFIASVAAGVWKFLHRKSSLKETNKQAEAVPREIEPQSEGPDSIITNWDELPPLPKKSLLEQILTDEIPVIEESPQIPTKTFIYGKHQTKTARIDQKETLKGPHFTRSVEPKQPTVEPSETTKRTPVAPEVPTTEKKLKAPSFRFDRSHPGTTEPVEEMVTPVQQQQGKTSPSKQKQSSAVETTHNSGILDRVLQAMQGVMPK